MLAVAAAALVATSIGARPASAQDAAAAEALFEEGKGLAAEDRWAEACPKFEASHAADPAVGTLLNWADCLEREGRLGSALARFEQAEAQLEEAGDPRAEIAATRAATLRPRAPRLRVRSSSPAPEGLVVTIDGAALPLADVASTGVEGPVDPGPRAVEVRRGDRVLDRREVIAAEGQHDEVVLDLAAIDRAAPEAPVAAPPPAGEPPSRAPLVAGWILTGTGGVALLAAGTLGAVALGEQAETEAFGACRGSICSPRGVAASETAGDLAEAAQWIGLAGVGLAAVGITLVLTAPEADPPASGALRLTAGPARVALDGRF